VSQNYFANGDAKNTGGDCYSLTPDVNWKLGSVWYADQIDLSDIFLGVPTKLGKNGIEEIIELQLNDEEMEMLKVSAGHVKDVMGVLDGMNIF